MAVVVAQVDVAAVGESSKFDFCFAGSYIGSAGYSVKPRFIRSTGSNRSPNGRGGVVVVGMLHDGTKRHRRRQELRRVDTSLRAGGWIPAPSGSHFGVAVLGHHDAPQALLALLSRSQRKGRPPAAVFEYLKHQTGGGVRLANPCP